MKRNSYMIGGGVLVLLIVIIVIILPQKPQPTFDGPVNQGPAFTKEGDLVFISKTNRDTISKLDIEIVDKDHEIESGLMYRKSMPENAGMLFIFDRMEPRSFWMKNTIIPLDIIFIDDFYQIVTIQANTVPQSERSIPSNKPAQYVLEVNGGYCQKNGIGEGGLVGF